MGGSTAVASLESSLNPTSVALTNGGSLSSDGSSGALLATPSAFTRARPFAGFFRVASSDNINAKVKDFSGRASEMPRMDDYRTWTPPRSYRKWSNLKESDLVARSRAVSSRRRLGHDFSDDVAPSAVGAPPLALLDLSIVVDPPFCLGAETPEADTESSVRGVEPFRQRPLGEVTPAAGDCSSLTFEAGADTASDGTVNELEGWPRAWTGGSGFALDMVPRGRRSLDFPTHWGGKGPGTVVCGGSSPGSMRAGETLPTVREIRLKDEALSVARLASKVTDPSMAPTCLPWFKGYVGAARSRVGGSVMSPARSSRRSSRSASAPSVKDLMGSEARTPSASNPEPGVESGGEDQGHGGRSGRGVTSGPLTRVVGRVGAAFGWLRSSPRPSSTRPASEASQESSGWTPEPSPGAWRPQDDTTFSRGAWQSLPRDLVAASLPEPPLCPLPEEPRTSGDWQRVQANRTEGSWRERSVSDDASGHSFGSGGGDGVTFREGGAPCVSQDDVPQTPSRLPPRSANPSCDSKDSQGRRKSSELGGSKEPGGGRSLQRRRTPQQWKVDYIRATMPMQLGQGEQEQGRMWQGESEWQWQPPLKRGHRTELHFTGGSPEKPQEQQPQLEVCTEEPGLLSDEDTKGGGSSPTGEGVVFNSVEVGEMHQSSGDGAEFPGAEDLSWDAVEFLQNVKDDDGTCAGEEWESGEVRYLVNGGAGDGDQIPNDTAGESPALVMLAEAGCASSSSPFLHAQKIGRERACGLGGDSSEEQSVACIDWCTSTPEGEEVDLDDVLGLDGGILSLLQGSSGDSPGTPAGLDSLVTEASEASEEQGLEWLLKWQGRVECEAEREGEGEMLSWTELQGRYGETARGQVGPQHQQLDLRLSGVEGQVELVELQMQAVREELLSLRRLVERKEEEMQVTEGLLSGMRRQLRAVQDALMLRGGLGASTVGVKLRQSRDSEKDEEEEEEEEEGLGVLLSLGSDKENDALEDGMEKEVGELEEKVEEVGEGVWRLESIVENARLLLLQPLPWGFLSLGRPTEWRVSYAPSPESANLAGLSVSWPQAQIGQEAPGSAEFADELARRLALIKLQLTECGQKSLLGDSPRGSSESDGEPMERMGSFRQPWCRGFEAASSPGSVLPMPGGRVLG